MAANLITYDLNNPGKGYNELFAAIQKLGRWCHPVSSTWIVITDSSSKDIRDHLSSYIDKNDELMVLKLEGSWATKGLTSEINEWLKANL